MKLGEEVDERVAVDEVQKLVEAGTSACSRSLSPALGDRLVEFVVV